MPKILFCTDFDGTVSKRAGQFTVFSPLYQSLLVTPDQNYRAPALKNNIQDILKAEFINPVNSTIDYTKPNADMLMSPEAVAFFHEALKNDDVKVNIFTKNRADYIKALFAFQGFTPAEMNKLVITDSGRKYHDLKAFIGSLGERAAHVYILDDSRADYDEMLRAATESGYKPAEITAHNKAVGAFQWADYQREVLAVAKPAAQPANPPVDATPLAAASQAANSSAAAAPSVAASQATKPTAAATSPADGVLAAAQLKEKLQQAKKADDPDQDNDDALTFQG